MIHTLGPTQSIGESGSKESVFYLYNRWVNRQYLEFTLSCLFHRLCAVYGLLPLRKDDLGKE